MSEREPISVQFARMCADDTHKRRIAVRDARACFEEIREHYGRQIAHDAFAAVLAQSSAARGDGRPKGQHQRRDSLWLAIHDWKKEQAPRKGLLPIAREIAADPAGEGLEPGTIRKRLNELLDARRLETAKLNGLSVELNDLP